MLVIFWNQTKHQTPLRTKFCNVHGPTNRSVFVRTGALARLAIIGQFALSSCWGCPAFSCDWRLNFCRFFLVVNLPKIWKIFIDQDRLLITHHQWNKQFLWYVCLYRYDRNVEWLEKWRFLYHQLFYLFHEKLAEMVIDCVNDKMKDHVNEVS